MAPVPRNKKSGSRRPTSQKEQSSVANSNATGYQKRKARSKSLKATLGLSDVYDFQQEKTKRGNIALTLDKDEADGFGAGDDDEEDDGTQRTRPRLLGENGDDEAVATDDDEEIDSDAAFEESDDERFAGFAFKKKVRPCMFLSQSIVQDLVYQPTPKSKSKSKKTAGHKNVHFAEVDLNEDEDINGRSEDSASDDDVGDSDEEEEGEDDEFINVLDVLDGQGEVDNLSDDDESSKKPTKEQKQISSLLLRSNDEENEEIVGNGDDDESDDDESPHEDEEITLSVSEDEDADVGDAIGRLDEFVSGLPTSGTKRKLMGDDEVENASNDQVKRRKKFLKDRTEGGVENEFGARAAGLHMQSYDSANYC